MFKRGGKMTYGYARVSTYGQAKDGNSLEYQHGALKANGADIIYSDSLTGAGIRRPRLHELLADIKGGDTLIVTKLDRIARSLTEGAALINALLERDIKIHILNIGVMDTTPASRLIRNIFLSFAEFEREMIIERCQEGRAIARQKPGYREGRPKKFTPEQMRHATTLLENHSYKQVAQMTKISKSTLQRAKKGNYF
jgi:DNA invertase Pin-like site-specific DNA recombinase